MKTCPDCRNPMPSLMLLDARVTPEYYCERCAKGFPVAEKPLTAPREAREPSLAGR